MKSLQQYSIPFSGLKNGHHSFELDVNDSFFNEFEYSIVKNGELKVDLDLEKQETMLILDFHIRGQVMVECDVCLSPLPVELDIREKQIAKFAAEEEDEDAEILVLNKNDHQVDVSTLIYEYINLAVPFINRCEDTGRVCDEEMISKLADLSGNTDEKTSGTDPRWEALKNIKDKNE